MVSAYCEGLYCHLVAIRKHNMKQLEWPVDFLGTSRKRGVFLWSTCHLPRTVLDPSQTASNCRGRGGFPGGAVVENLPATAGDTGSSPGLGRSHMPRSPRSNWAREPHLLSLRVWSLCSATREAATVRGPCTAMKSGPHLPQLEKALAQKRRPNTAKNKYIKINK